MIRTMIKIIRSASEKVQFFKNSTKNSAGIFLEFSPLGAILRRMQPDAAIIQTLTVEEAPYLAPNGLIPDDGLLQKLARRNLLFPLESKCRYRDGIFEILVEQADFQKATDAIQSHLAAIEQISKNNYAEAIVSLQRLLAINPYFSSGRIDLSRLHAGMDRTDEALDELVEGLRIDPDNPDYYGAASYLLAGTESNRHVAERYASKAIELGTRVPLADYVMGYLAVDGGNLADSLRHFDRMLELRPSAFVAHHGRALVFGRMGRFKNAAIELEKFFAATRGMVLDSELVETSQGMYLQCCGHLEERTKSARARAVRREMARVEAELGWCVVLREKNDPDEESSAFTPAILWRNHIPPGTVVLQGQRYKLDHPDFLLESLLEIRIETQARKRNRSSRPTLRQQAERLAANAGESPASLPDEFGHEECERLFASFRELCASVIFGPVSWLIDARVLSDFPLFKWSLLTSIHGAVTLQLQACEDDGLGELMMPDTHAALVAMLGANALILEDLSNGALDLTARFRELPFWSRSLHIRDHWKNRVERKFKPGDEAALIDEIAAIAGFVKDRQIQTQGRLF